MSVDRTFIAASVSRHSTFTQLPARHDIGPSPLKNLQQRDVEKGEVSAQDASTNIKKQVIPHNNLPVVFTGLALTLFLAALDGTIVAIAMTTIVDDLGDTSGYSWIASSYLLATACVAPLCGKLSDIIGRKPVLYTSVFFFLLGSALCGAAQNMVWLIVSRGLQGLGGGGLMQIVMTIISDIVEDEKRPLYFGVMTAINGASTVLGPLIGGALTQHLSWRWCFWINLPTGVLAMAVVVFFLNLNPPPKRSIKEISTTFDFLGLFLITAGVIALLIGFEEVGVASKGWLAPQTIAPLAAGLFLLVVGGVNEVYTKREPVFSARLFKNRTTTSLMVGMFIQSLTSMCVSYYVPLYFQILGSSTTLAGIKQLPVSFGSTLVSIVVGWIIVRTLKYRTLLWAGYAIVTLGYGLMITFSEKTPTWQQELILIVMGLGTGCLYEPPFIGLIRAMPQEDMASSTGASSLVRLMGGAIGVSVGDSIFSTELNKRIASIPEASSLGLGTSGSSTGFTGLVQIQPISLRLEVLHAYTKSLSAIWIVACPLSFFGFLILLLIKEYPPKKFEDENGDKPTDQSQGDGSHLSGPGKAPADKDRPTSGTRNTVSQDADDSSEYFDATDGSDDHDQLHSTRQEKVGRIRFWGPLSDLLHDVLEMLRELVVFLARYAPL